MALKFISFADLLQTGGDGGVSGDDGRKANAHAGVAVPLAPTRASPPTDASGAHGEIRITGGDDHRQYSCGFEAIDPTDPAIPTCSQGMATPSSSYDVGQPVSIDQMIEAWDELDSAQGCRECSSAMSAGELEAWLDDFPEAFPAPQPAAFEFETRALPVDPMAWRALGATYHAHHFSCPTCIAAGRSLQYGLRCDAGLLLWEAYAEQPAPDFECIKPIHPIPLPLQECHDEQKSNVQN